jgi:hypothetical protein
MKSLENTVNQDKTVKNAMMCQGGYSEASLSKALHWDPKNKNGPEIRFRDPGHWGPASYSKEDNVIYVNTRIVDEFKAGGSKAGLNGGELKLWTEAYLLHEMVHYGQQNTDEFWGIRFNQDAYGIKTGNGAILRSSMKDIWSAFKNRRPNY